MAANIFVAANDFINAVYDDTATLDAIREAREAFDAFVPENGLTLSELAKIAENFAY